MANLVSHAIVHFGVFVYPAVLDTNLRLNE